MLSIFPELRRANSPSSNGPLPPVCARYASTAARSVASEVAAASAPAESPADGAGGTAGDSVVGGGAAGDGVVGGGAAGGGAAGPLVTARGGRVGAGCVGAAYGSMVKVPASSLVAVSWNALCCPGSKVIGTSTSNWPDGAGWSSTRRLCVRTDLYLLFPTTCFAKIGVRSGSPTRAWSTAIPIGTSVAPAAGNCVRSIEKLPARVGLIKYCGFDGHVAFFGQPPDSSAVHEPLSVCCGISVLALTTPFCQCHWKGELELGSTREGALFLRTWSHDRSSCLVRPREEVSSTRDGTCCRSSQQAWPTSCPWPTSPSSLVIFQRLPTSLGLPC